MKIFETFFIDDLPATIKFIKNFGTGGGLRPPKPTGNSRLVGKKEKPTCAKASVGRGGERGILGPVVVPS